MREPIALGLITPSENNVLEGDFPRLGLDGVRFHFHRVENEGDDYEQFAEMKVKSGEAAKLLSHARRTKAIALACTAGSFLEGVGYDESVAKTIEAASGLPAVTTAGSVVAALHALGIERLAVFTPYEEWVSRRLVTFLEGHDFFVAHLSWGYDMYSTDVEDCYEAINDWVASQVPSDIDGVLISCTNFTWLRGIAPLEERLGLPVVTSNLATLWQLLHRVGADDRLPQDLAKLCKVKPLSSISAA
ncbi:hypothetical protein GFL85_35900 [Rhizobium laguerreae]|uniref:maleate cis-trans isomerase family protein n=1 Tax=Rhizobium laguerreae TaxID=1076926 RepID=UPI00143F4ACA|nr:hypothetical protein [Rhizobium laguerreae]NKM16214.1 hypothetical protein [Rhizobium laguerreae]